MGWVSSALNKANKPAKAGDGDNAAVATSTSASFGVQVSQFTGLPVVNVPFQIQAPLPAAPVAPTPSLAYEPLMPEPLEPAETAMASAEPPALLLDIPDAPPSVPLAYADEDMTGLYPVEQPIIDPPPVTEEAFFVAPPPVEPSWTETTSDLDFSDGFGDEASLSFAESEPMELQAIPVVDLSTGETVTDAAMWAAPVADDDLTVPMLDISTLPLEDDDPWASPDHDLVVPPMPMETTFNNASDPFSETTVNPSVLEQPITSDDWLSESNPASSPAVSPIADSFNNDEDWLAEPAHGTPLDATSHFSPAMADYPAEAPLPETSTAFAQPIDMVANTVTADLFADSGDDPFDTTSPLWDLNVVTTPVVDLDETSTTVSLAEEPALYPLNTDDVAPFYPQHHELIDHGLPLTSVILPPAMPSVPAAAAILADSPLSLLEPLSLDDDDEWSLDDVPPTLVVSPPVVEPQSVTTLDSIFDDDDPFLLTTPEALETFPAEEEVLTGTALFEDNVDNTPPSVRHEPAPELTDLFAEDASIDWADTPPAQEEPIVLTTPTPPVSADAFDPPLFERNVTPNLAVQLVASDQGHVLLQTVNPSQPQQTPVALRLLPQRMVPTNLDKIRISKEMQLKNKTIYRVELGRWTGLFSQDDHGHVAFRDELLLGEDA